MIYRPKVVIIVINHQNHKNITKYHGIVPAETVNRMNDPSPKSGDSGDNSNRRHRCDHQFNNYGDSVPKRSYIRCELLEGYVVLKHIAPDDPRLTLTRHLTPLLAGRCTSLPRQAFQDICGCVGPP